MAAVVSRVTGVSNGYQAAYITALARDLNGFQMSAIYNGVNGTVHGYQITGILNRAGGDLNGLQAAGLLNIVSGKTSGGQAGLINVAGDVSGFQLGFINIARQMNGVPLGLINIARNGSVSAVAYATNFSGANVGAKFVVNNFVSSIALGGYDAEERIDTAVAFAATWGYHIPLNPLYVEIDLASMAMGRVVRESNQTPTARQLNAVRVSLGWDIARFLGIFAGVGAGFQIENEEWRDGEFKPLVFGGVTVF